MPLPRLYAILDRATLDARSLTPEAVTAELLAAGVDLFQYRDKTSAPQAILRTASALNSQLATHNSKLDSNPLVPNPTPTSPLIPQTSLLNKPTLLLNDRPDLAALSGCGCHVGHLDLAPADARRVLGPDPLLGVSTHTAEQVSEADQSEADYIAIGPVFATSTKLNAEPIVGLDFITRARHFSTKPLVAIGGITLANARSVIDAGADSVAIISGLFVPGRTVRDVAQDFLHRLR